MIPEIGFWFCGKILIFPIFTGRHAKCRTWYLSCQYCIVSLLCDISLTPLIGEILPDSDTTKPLIDPVCWISFLLIELFHPFLSKLWILFLFDTLVSDLCEPPLKWLSFGWWYRLDDTENPLSMSTVGLSHLPIRCDEFQLYEKIVQFSLDAFFWELDLEITPVSTRILTIRKSWDDIDDRKILLLLMPYLSDFCTFEERYGGILSHRKDKSMTIVYSTLSACKVKSLVRYTYICIICILVLDSDHWVSKI